MTNVGGYSSKKAVQTLSVFVLCTALTFPGVVRADESKETPFTDIENHWAKQAIIESHENGILSGIGKTDQFQPERYMTRGEFFAMVDRFYLRTEDDLFSLSLLTEDDENGWGDGFSEPYLPYTDVDRLTWAYPSVLRIAMVYDRLFGEHAFEGIYPKGQLHPEEPITREEAAKVLRLFIANQDGLTNTELMHKWGLFTGELNGNFKRAEAAVLANRLTDYLQEHPILPLLDYDDSRFPIVPEITEIYPMFANYGSDLTEAENNYVKSVNLIMDHEDEEDTFQTLEKLANSSFPNQVGVQYYLSWNQFEPLTKNLDYAFQALTTYTELDAKQKSVETMRLLAANIYDIALQIGNDDPSIFTEVLKRLIPYEKQVDSQEHNVFALYLAALEVKSGKNEDAISRYQSLNDQPIATHNAIYYLIQNGQMDKAKQVAQTIKDQGSEQAGSYFSQIIQDELSIMGHQAEYADQLKQALMKQDASTGYQATGETNLSGYLFHYVDQVDNRAHITHTSGYYKSPNKLVLDKMEMYTDDSLKRYYSYDFDDQKWSAPKKNQLDYVHEWVQQQDIETRLHQLHARYARQSVGNVDVITEWISGKTLQAEVAKQKLAIQSVKDIPVFITKYYIDRTSSKLLSRSWRYEEIYDKEYIAYVGSESYEPYEKPIRIPQEAVNGTVTAP